MIHIVGLGPGDFGQITLETLTLLEGEAPIYLRTAVHPSVADLTKRGVTFKSFDALYEEKNAFEGVYATIVDTLVAAGVYATIVDTLVAAAKKGGDLVYGVPGNPLCAETSVAETSVVSEATSKEKATAPGTGLPGGTLALPLLLLFVAGTMAMGIFWRQKQR